MFFIIKYKTNINLYIKLRIFYHFLKFSRHFYELSSVFISSIFLFQNFYQYFSIYLNISVKPIFSSFDKIVLKKMIS